jgi:sialate O-acetylesterase
MHEGLSKRATVSLTFDDALPVHLDVAVPELERAGLSATFYVSAGADTVSERRDEWREAAASGHEIGNHTLFHPGVSSKPWVTDGIAIENYTLDRMRVELVTANRILSSIDGRKERSFAFPCSNPWMGRPGWPRRVLTKAGLERTRVMGFIDRHGLDFRSRLIDYTPLVRELFPASRCGGMPPSEIGAQLSDAHRVRGVEGDGESYGALIAAVDTAIERGAWLVFVFHGVGGGHRLSCDLDVFRRLLRRLADDERIEVSTFLDASKRQVPRMGE